MHFQISRILMEIKDRFVARLALRRQLDVLEKVKVVAVDLTLPEPLMSEFPLKINSKLRAWTLVDLEQYMALAVTQHLRDGDAVSSSDFFFRLQVTIFSQLIGSLFIHAHQKLAAIE